MDTAQGSQHAPSSPHYYSSSPGDNSSAPVSVFPGDYAAHDLAVCTVADAIRVPEVLVERLELARGFRKDVYEFVGHKYAHIGYVTNVLRPYAEMIFACIPSTVLAPEEFPLGRIDFLKRHVIEYMCQAVSLYAFELFSRSDFLRRFLKGLLKNAPRSSDTSHSSILPSLGR